VSTPPIVSSDVERVVLDGIRWSTYQALLEDLSGLRPV
jgi:hypothetical protein